MYLSYDERYWIIDIEGDSLTPKHVWCMCYENAITKEKGVLKGHDEIKQWFDDHPDGIFVGHNILKFDAPVLNRVVGTKLPLSRLVDTLILATLYNPAMSGGHSLAAWGRRFKLYKGEFNDWSHLSDEMIEYCHQDVTVTKELFLRLVAVMIKLGFSERSCEIQHKFMHILAQQQKNGFAFDYPRAHAFYVELKQREDELRDLIYHKFPPEMQCVRTYRNAYKRDGSYSKNYESHSEQFPKVVINDDGSYEAYDWVEFNLGSPKQRVEKLLELGWKPRKDELTPTGNPKPTIKGKLVPSLAEFAEEGGIPEVALIAKWISVNSRSSMINTWLDAYNHNTGCIHGSVQVAQTLRLRHNNPNTANIPAVRVYKKGHPNEDQPILGEEGYFTYEARDLWTCRDTSTRTLVGTDAAGLELRMLAHYLGNEEFTEQVVHGDPHVYNAGILGTDKPTAKTFIYAFLYGAGDAKIGSIVGGSAKQGKALKVRFINDFGGLDRLLAEIASEFDTGRIELVDGSKVICPTKHAALNYKLQGGGARVMAQGAIFLAGHIRRKGLDSLKVGDIHDEWQYDVLKADAEEHARLAVQSIREAGEELNMNVPLDGESKLGLTWALTH